MARKPWTAKKLERLRVLFDKIGSVHHGETEAPQKAILKMLLDHECLWSDLPELLGEARQEKTPPPPPPPPDNGGRITALELFRVSKAIYENHVSLDEHEYAVCALWAMHTHVFRNFMHTPRLIFSGARSATAARRPR